MELLALGKIIDQLPMSSSIDGPLFQTKKTGNKIVSFCECFWANVSESEKKIVNGNSY